MLGDFLKIYLQTFSERGTAETFPLLVYSPDSCKDQAEERSQEFLGVSSWVAGTQTLCHFCFSQVTLTGSFY